MEQHSIISIYATLKAYLAKIPEHDTEYRQGFQDALLLTYEGMKLCPAVNHALEIRRLERSLESAVEEIIKLKSRVVDLNRGIVKKKEKMTVEAKIGEHELVFVKVSPDARDFRISKGFPDPPLGDLVYTTDLNVWHTGDEILPEGEWEILGDPFELSEAIYDFLMPGLIFGHTKIHKSYEDNTPVDTAKESFESLLYLLKVFKEHPLEDPGLTMKQGDGSVYYTASDEDFAEYAFLEERVGNWVLLIKKP